MKLSKQQQNEQLDYIYQLLRDSLKMRSTIKGWCITLWSGFLVITFVQFNNIFIQFPSLENALIVKRVLLVAGFLCTPVFFFWILEAIEAAKTYIYKKQIIEMEKSIVKTNSNIRINDPEDFFVMTVYHKTSLGRKLLCFLNVLFFSETIISFYLLFTIISIAISILIVGMSMSGVQLRMTP